jgi:hypothetical protein
MWLTAGVMAALLGSLLYGSWLNEQQSFGTWYALLFDQSEGRLFSAFSAGLLLMAGHLSGLIGWARSRSPNDFGGRYRVWRPIALVFYLAVLAVVLRADEVLNAALDVSAVSLPWRVPQWNWMIPTAGLAAIVMWIVHREMAVSNLSRAHAWLGLVCLLAGLGLPFVPEDRFPIESVPLLEQGLILGGLMLIGLSLMWFGRHVLFVSSDPAERKPSLMLRILKSLFRRRATKPKKQRTEKSRHSDSAKKPGGKQSAPAAESKSRSSSSSKKTSSRRRGRRKSTAKVEEKEPERKTVDPEPVAPAAETEKPQLKLRVEDLATGKMDADILQERLEMMELLAEEGEALDQDLLKGLTKKQKKQMRSAWRDLERQYSHRKAG